VGFADPFDERLAEVVRGCGHSLEGEGVRLHDRGTLICMGTLRTSSKPAISQYQHHESQASTKARLTHRAIAEGPQFSTRAESNLYRSWGGSVINMSALPEAKLAREAEIAYQMICMSTDYDCWHSTSESVSVDMVMGHMKANAGNARRVVGAVLDELSKEEHADLVLARHLEGQTRFATGMTAGRGRGGEVVGKLGWLFPGEF